MSSIGLKLITVCASLIALVNPALADEPDYCEVYCPGHFGNWYEVAGENEMRAMLVEARWWGFNRYGDWYESRRQYQQATAGEED